jgi:hypothetical protein
MAASETVHHEDYGDYVTNRSWFIAFGIALLFGIVWSMVGESSMKLVFVTVAFILFLRSGIRTEMSARALAGH